MGSLGLGALSHLHLRVRVPGGANEGQFSCYSHLHQGDNALQTGLTLLLRALFEPETPNANN
jgi:hypothetical protein